MTEKITIFDRVLFVVTILVAVVDVSILDLLMRWAMKLVLGGNAFEYLKIYFVLINFLMFAAFGVFAFLHVRKKYFGMGLFLAIMPNVLALFELDVLSRFAPFLHHYLFSM